MADGDVWQAINTATTESGRLAIWLSDHLDLAIWIR